MLYNYNNKQSSPNKKKCSFLFGFELARSKQPSHQCYFRTAVDKHTNIFIKPFLSHRHLYSCCVFTGENSMADFWSAIQLRLLHGIINRKLFTR